MATVEHGPGQGHLEIPSTATPPPSRGAKLSAGMLTMVFFIGSEVMLFGSFFTAYFFVRYNVADTWPPLNQDGEPFELPKVITAVNTAILVASSFTLHWAEHRLKHYNDRKGLQRGLIVTILLGATFLIIQINEYVHLGFTPQDTAFGSSFYTLTGAHGLHVFVGLTILTLCLVRVMRARDFSPNASTPLGAGSLYWHFVDVVWVLLFFLVYLL
jgi:cytochrome c oxidase subunit III